MSFLKLERGSEFDKTWYLHIGKNTFAHLQNDWVQLFGKYNWKTYRLADIQYENDGMVDGWEVSFVLLGIGFRVRYNNPDGELMKDFEKRLKDE